MGVGITRPSSDKTDKAINESSLKSDLLALDTNELLAIMIVELKIARLHYEILSNANFTENDIEV